MTSIKEKIADAEKKISIAAQSAPDPRSKRYEVNYDGEQYFYIFDTGTDSYYSKDFGVPMRFVHEDTASKLVGELNNSISKDDRLPAAPASARVQENTVVATQHQRADC